MRHWRIGLFLVVFVWSAGPTVRAADEDLPARLKSFIEKVQAAGATGQNTPDSARDHMQAQRREITQRFVIQLRMIEAAIHRRDFEEARQMVERLQHHGGTGVESDDWIQLAPTLDTELADLARQSQEQWYSEVDALLKQTRDTCLAAQDAAALDPLLVRAAALQMRRSSRSDALVERGNEKLNGIVQTLQNWARYLDQRSAGNAKAANEILQRFQSNTSQFPVLSSEMINTKFIPIDRELPREERAQAILDRIKSREDLPAAIEEWQKMMNERTSPGAAYSGQAELGKLQAVQKAWEAVDRKQYREAHELLVTADRSTGNSNLTQLFVPLRNAVAHAAILGKAREVPGFNVPPDVAAETVVEQALEHLRKAGQFQNMLEMIDFASRIERPPTAGRNEFRREPVENFLAAQRFETAGDPLSAIVKYREVVDSPAGPYVPHQEAQEALGKLQAKHPEMFKDYEGVVLQELRNLQRQLQMIRRSPVRPF